MAATYNQIAARGLERISGLSDGLFAVAMTLIVLEIRVPDLGPTHSDAALWTGLVALGPRFLTYLLSFLTLGIFWSGQQTQLNYFARADRHLAWIHLGLLATVALLPFSTSLLADYIELRLALLVYWANIAAFGVFIYGSWATPPEPACSRRTPTPGYRRRSGDAWWAPRPSTRWVLPCGSSVPS